MRELVAALGAAGIPSAIAVPARERPEAPDVSCLPCGTWPVPFGPIVRLPAARSLPGPTVVHVHGVGSLVPWSAFARAGGAGPAVATLHGALDRRLAVGVAGPRRWWHDRVDVPLLRRLDGLHVTRDSEARSAAPFVREGAEVRRLPWFLSDGPGRVVPGRPARPYLLFSGRLHPIKGVERLLRAMAEPAGRASGLRLALAGAGRPAHVAALSREARRLGVRDRVEFLGWVGAETMRALYAEAAALALPSLYESFGMVVVEALREGCPVLAARETPWEDLDASGAGRRLDFDDPAATADALERAAEPAARAEAGGRARALYEREFTPSVGAPRFVAWYHDVVRRWRAARAA